MASDRIQEALKGGTNANVDSGSTIKWLQGVTSKARQGQQEYTSAHSLKATQAKQAQGNEEENILESNIRSQANVSSHKSMRSGPESSPGRSKTLQDDTFRALLTYSTDLPSTPWKQLLESTATKATTIQVSTSHAIINASHGSTEASVPGQHPN
eukprot:6492574-Amphidinium_carterae.4